MQRKGSALCACEQAGSLLHSKPVPLNPRSKFLQKADFSQLNPDVQQSHYKGCASLCSCFADNHGAQK